MIARVALWDPMPVDDRDWVVAAAGAVPGVVDAFHLVDPRTGNGMTIALFEDDVDVHEVKASIERRAAQLGWSEVPRPVPVSETIYRVLPAGPASAAAADSPAHQPRARHSAS